MMNIRQAEISKTMADWLALYSPPRQIAGKPDEMQREMDRLIGVVLKYAPKEGWNGWVQSALDQLGYQLKARVWPTMHEVGAVCANARKQSRELSQAEPAKEFDVYELNAQRMRDGQAVGEGFLYGKEAVEMIARRLIDQETMTRYRSAAFMTRKKLYGEAAALTWEVEAKARHESAKAIRKERAAA